jgi:hypothetical protein
MDTSPLVTLRYMKASRVTAPVVVTIAGLEMHDMRDGAQKPVLIFENGPALVLNVENLYALQDSMGFESDDWIGARIEIQPTTFTTQSGEVKPMLTVRVIEKPRAAAEGAEAAQATPTPAPTPKPKPASKKKSGGDMDDEIPF